MTRRQKIKNFTLSLVFWGVLCISFLFFSSLIMLKANGYQLNWKTWKFSKTGMIILDGNPSGTIFLDGVAIKKQGYPNKLSNLRSGTYEIKVQAGQYQTWSKNIDVEAGQANVYGHILLFKTGAIDATVPSNLTADELAAESKNLAMDIKIIDSEIFYQDHLLTRFSSAILSAVMFSDNQHLVFQQGRQIRVMDLDGSNNKLLFELTSEAPTSLSFRSNGSILVYVDTTNSTIKAKTIR